MVDKSKWWEEAQSVLAKPARRLLQGLEMLPTPKWDGLEMENLSSKVFLPTLPVWGKYPWWNTNEMLSETCVATLSRSNIQTIGQLINAYVRLTQITNILHYKRWLLWYGVHSQTALVETIHSLQELWNVLPNQVQQQAAQQTLNQPILTSEEIWESISTFTNHIRWDKTNANVDGALITVKEAISLIRDDTYKTDKWKRYMTLAEDTNHLNTCQTRMLKLFKRLWQCEVLNRFKEPFWRLVYDAIPTPARMRMPHLACVCGHKGADRSHIFWECEVAKAILQSIQQWISTEINKQMVWMVQAPSGMYERVWEIIVLLMIYTIDRIRRQSTRDRIQHTQGMEIDLWKRRAVAIFKKHLVEFVIRQGVTPGCWIESRLENNPIIYINSEESHEDAMVSSIGGIGVSRRKLRICI